MHNENWDDLRYVIAVSELGSVLRAARRLGVNHATVLRRVSAFEERHGAPLFDRSRQGYRLFPDKAHVIAAARAAEAAMAEVARLATGAQAGLKGLVRITSTDTLAYRVLPDFVTRAGVGLDGLRVTLQSSNQHIDLTRERADLIVRPAERLPEDLVGRIAGQLRFAVYASPGAADGRWLSLSGPLARTAAARWMAETLPEERIGSGADSFLTLAQLAGKGAGRVVLPTMIGEEDPALVAVDAGMPPFSVPLWVARPADAPADAAVKLVETRLAVFLATRLGMHSPQPR